MVVWDALPHLQDPDRLTRCNVTAAVVTALIFRNNYTAANEALLGALQSIERRYSCLWPTVGRRQVIDRHSGPQGRSAAACGAEPPITA